MKTESLHEAMLSMATRVIVHEAAIRALVATHPAPDQARAVAESLLMQAQGKIALSDVPPSVFGDHAQHILDSLFRPPVALPPDAG